MQSTKFKGCSIGWFKRMVARSFLFVLVGVISGCGFQLNRNKLQLPNQAQSISIAKIENKSFVPRLDIRLKALLIEKLSTNLIALKSVSQSDLVLNFVLSTFSSSQSEYSLDETGQTYEFQFNASGELTVFDNRTDKFILNRELIKSSYSVITQAADLSSTEVEEAREEVLNSLSQVIAEKLTDNF